MTKDSAASHRAGLVNRCAVTGPEPMRTSSTRASGGDAPHAPVSAQVSASTSDTRQASPCGASAAPRPAHRASADGRCGVARGNRNLHTLTGNVRIQRTGSNGRTSDGKRAGGSNTRGVIFQGNTPDFTEAVVQAVDFVHTRQHRADTE